MFAVKRLIGRRFEEKEVQKDIGLMPYKIVRAENGDAWVEAHGQKLAPPQYSAEVLRKMKKTAEDYLGEPVTEAVITVPAYFNDSQRQATKDVAASPVSKSSGSSTSLRLRARVRSRQSRKGDRKIAVFDLGGGTFDISIIEIADVDGEMQFEVLSTNGDTFLGGEDFDPADHRLHHQRIQERAGRRSVEGRARAATAEEAAEKAKIELSSSQQTESTCRTLRLTHRVRST